MSAPPKASVLVANDQPIVRFALSHFIRKQFSRRLSVLGEASSSTQIRELISEKRPHLLLTDIRLQSQLCLELIEWVRGGRIKFRERVSQGLESAPQAFIEMMQGANIGKQLVKISER